MIHLSWAQTSTGKQVWSIHHTPTCKRSCEAKIQNWVDLKSCVWSPREAS